MSQQHQQQGRDPAAHQRRKEARRRRSQVAPLALWLRILLFLVGWILVLVGIAGLVLPGVQGIVTIVAGAAVLSLVSELAFNLLRHLMRRWPRGWEKVIRFRRWAHQKLARFHGESSAPPDLPPRDADPRKDERTPRF